MDLLNLVTLELVLLVKLIFQLLVEVLQIFQPHIKVDIVVNLEQLPLLVAVQLLEVHQELELVELLQLHQDIKLEVVELLAELQVPQEFLDLELINPEHQELHTKQEQDINLEQEDQHTNLELDHHINLYLGLHHSNQVLDISKHQASHQEAVYLVQVLVQLELELEELQVLELHILQHLELELEQVMVQLLNKEAKLEQQEQQELLELLHN